MMLRYRFHQPLFEAHIVGTEHGLPRYAALPVASVDAQHASLATAREVILDYSGLLTLWSLFRDDVIERLRACFATVVIPATLLQALHHEQEWLAQRGQPARYYAQVLLRDTILRQPSKFPRHEPSVAGLAWQSNRLPVAAIARSLSLPWLNEHLPDEGAGFVQTIGLRSLARLLFESGVVDPADYQALLGHARPARPEEANYARQLGFGSEIVADAATLTSIAIIGGLAGVCRFFARIHLAESEWQLLLAEISTFEENRRLLGELRALRAVVQRGIDDGLLEPRSLQPEQRLIGTSRLRMAEGGQDDIDADPVVQLALDYTDDLVGLAHFGRLPICTDDRWTSRLHWEKRQPAFFFGTDAVIERLHRSGILGDDAAFATYARLVRWRYVGLTVHPAYLAWLIEQGVEPTVGAAADVARLYCDGIVAAFDLAAGGNVGADFLVRVELAYNDGLMKALWRLFQRSADVEVGARLFRSFDLARSIPQMEGQEPQYLFNLLVAVLFSGLGSPEERRVVLAHLPKFIPWLDAVMLRSGVGEEEVSEGWYLIVQAGLSALDNASSEQEQIVLGTLSLILGALPDRVTAYLIAGNLGQHLEQVGLLQPEPQLSVEFTPPDGERRRMLLSEVQWIRDYNEAVGQYVSAPTDEPVRAGLVTLRVEEVSRTSICLTFRVAPTVIVEEQGAMTGGLVRHACLLPAFASENERERRGMWAIGLRRLEELRLPTEEWRFLHDQLLSDDRERWERAGEGARRYLLGQWQVARAYLAEAARLGRQGLLLLLRYIEPEVVRSWLNLPASGQLNEQLLLERAQHVVSTTAGDDRDAESDAAGVKALLARFGHSIFADARVFRGPIIAALGAAEGAGKCQERIQQLAAAARASASAAVKANVVLALLEWQAQVRSGSAEHDEVVHQIVASLLEQIAGAFRPTDGHQAAAQDLVHELSRHLYATWAGEAGVGGEEAADLAYLAWCGANFIVDAISDQMTEQVLQDISGTLADHVLHRRVERGAERQPAAFFCPEWQPYVNYPLSFLLQSAASEGLDLIAASAEGIREMLLWRGVEHRFLQAFMGYTATSESWLDAALTADVPGIVVRLWEEAHREDVASWSERQKFAWQMCSSTEAGTTLVTETLARLPGSDDEGAFRIIGLVFLGVQTGRSSESGHLKQLLAPEQLERIRKSPACWQEVLWRLSILLRGPTRLDMDTEALARAVMFDGAVAGEPEALAITADVFSQLAALGFEVERIAGWVKEIAAHEAVALQVVRRALRPFVRLLPHYDEDVKSVMMATLLEIGRRPRYSHFWELQRIARD